MFNLSSKLMVQVMSTAWSVMWNVTDETPANSERFLDKNGMEVTNSFMILQSIFFLLGLEQDTILNITAPSTNYCVSFPATKQLKRFYAKVFLQCKEAFPDTMDLLRNMMGLLGNIAEVSH